jgi:hypothetical protein
MDQCTPRGAASTVKEQHWFPMSLTFCELLRRPDSALLAEAHAGALRLPSDSPPPPPRAMDNLTSGA